VVIERFAAEVGRVLAHQGRILLLISSLTGLLEVRDLFSERGYFPEIMLQEAVEDEMLYVLKIVRTP
jgi:release factor glutamine methyltransferase